MRDPHFPLVISIEICILFFHRLTNETDIKSYQQKLREVEKASDEFQSKLAKKEREAEARTQEKEELLDTVNKMKTKLEREAASHYDAKQHITDLNRHIEELKAQVKNKENLLLALITNRQAMT